MRWIVGDVQGCAREFDDLLEWVRFAPGRDELWSLGDLVNRGPDSLAALRLWRAAGGSGLLGNHDVYALLARSGRRARKADTLDALYAAEDADPLLAGLRALPILARLNPADRVPSVWLVHAGLDPRWSDIDEVARSVNPPPHDDAWLERDEVACATRLRCCSAAGERSSYSGPLRGCPPGYRPWDAFYNGETLVVHGHWAQRGAYRGTRTMGLDSGCVYGGRLTAWCQEEDRIVQIPARERGGPVRDFPSRRLPAE